MRYRFAVVLSAVLGSASIAGCTDSGTPGTTGAATVGSGSSSGDASGGATSTGSSAATSTGSAAASGTSGTSGSSGGSTSGGVSNLVPSLATLDFGNVVINTTLKKTISLMNQSAVTASGIGAQVVGGTDAALFMPSGVPTSLAGDASAQVDVSFSPLALELSSQASLSFSDADGSQASVDLTGVPVGVALQLSANPVDFGYVPVGTTVVACVTLTAWANVGVDVTGVAGFDNGGGAFALSQVDGATPPNPAPVPVSIPAGGSAEVCFSLTPPQSEQITGQVTLVTDDPSGVDPTLILTGWGGGPQISCVPTSVDFGPVRVGEISTKPVLCTNTGTALAGVALQIGPVSAGVGPFTAECDPTMDPCPDGGLAPGDSAQIDVTYTPLTPVANDTGTLSVPNNGARGITISIPLSGQGSG